MRDRRIPRSSSSSGASAATAASSSAISSSLTRKAVVGHGHLDELDPLRRPHRRRRAPPLRSITSSTTTTSPTLAALPRLLVPAVVATGSAATFRRRLRRRLPARLARWSWGHAWPRTCSLSYLVVFVAFLRAALSGAGLGGCQAFVVGLLGRLRRRSSARMVLTAGLGGRLLGRRLRGGLGRGLHRGFGHGLASRRALGRLGGSLLRQRRTVPLVLAASRLGRGSSSRVLLACGYDQDLLVGGIFARGDDRRFIVVGAWPPARGTRRTSAGVFLDHGRSAIERRDPGSA